MSLFLLVFTSISLSMDCFAVSIVNGVRNKSDKILKDIRIAIIFAIFHVLMPLIGWLIGGHFLSFIEDFDHWLAFALLAIIGIKMLFEADSNDEQVRNKDKSLIQIFLLAFATSIDALAVGISLGVLEVPIMLTLGVFGAITFVISMIGLRFGSLFGMKFGRIAEIAGGIVLILIGLKILIEHLYFC